MKRLLVLFALLTLAGSAHAAGWWGNSLPLTNEGFSDGLNTTLKLSPMDGYVGNHGRRIICMDSGSIADGSAYCFHPHAILWDTDYDTADTLAFQSARTVLHIESGTARARIFGPTVIDSFIVTVSANPDSSQDNYRFIDAPVDSIHLFGEEAVEWVIEAYWP